MLLKERQVSRPRCFVFEIWVLPASVFVFETTLGVWTNLENKTSWASLIAKQQKQAITVGSSSGFNVRLLHDWSNFDLPKLMPVKHISLMPVSCLSITITIYLYGAYSLRVPNHFTLIKKLKIALINKRFKKWLK